MEKMRFDLEKVLSNEKSALHACEDRMRDEPASGYLLDCIRGKGSEVYGPRQARRPTRDSQGVIFKLQLKRAVYGQGPSRRAGVPRSQEIPPP
jgi:hypothetical protein